MLRANFEKITQHRLEVETDGLVRLEDQQWGKYLLTFEHDHLEIIGFNHRVSPRHVTNLVVDNIRLNEIEHK